MASEAHEVPLIKPRVTLTAVKRPVERPRVLAVEQSLDDLRRPNGRIGGGKDVPNGNIDRIHDVDLKGFRGASIPLLNDSLRVERKASDGKSREHLFEAA